MSYSAFFFVASMCFALRSEHVVKMASEYADERCGQLKCIKCSYLITKTGYVFVCNWFLVVLRPRMVVDAPSNWFFEF